MTSPDARPRRALLVEKAGADSDLDAEHAARLRSAGSFFWLDLSGVAPERVVESSTALGMDPEDMQHLLQVAERSHYTETDQGVRFASYGMSDDTRLTQVRGAFTKSYLVTAHDEPCRGLAEARDRYERFRDSDQDDGPLVLFMVLDALATTFESVIPRLEGRLDELETEVLGGLRKTGYLQQIIEIRQVLTPIIRGLSPYRRDLVSLLGSVDRAPGMESGAQQYFDSHQRHVIALYDAANDCRDGTRDAVEAFNSANSERQGEVINWLTMVAAVFLPLTFVTGYFGMNFSIITRLHGTLSFVLLAVLIPGVLATSTVLALRFLIRRVGVRLIPARAVRAATTPSASESSAGASR